MNMNASCSKISCVFVLVSLCSFYSLFAQGSGSMKGRVLDKDNGEPLIGTNIVIQNTSLGVAADIDGKFYLPTIPVGTWTVKVSCLGYMAVTREITMTAGVTIEQEFRLKPQAIMGEEVVVTVQARGQNAAINQQLTSERIANIVSSARIQELPDANAAESIGRLPGVSLLRSGGEATQVVIRGLEPKYSTITIDGIALPSTSSSVHSNDLSVSLSSSFANSGDRSTDLSMISSTSLEGIEVFKTVTADMDAAVIGGTVNFDIRHAKSSSEDLPLVSFLAQGAYKGMLNSYRDYKFVGSVEKRFFSDKFGVFVQGIAQRQNLTSDQLSAYYYADNLNTLKNPDTIAMGYTSLSFVPTIQKRYDGTVTLDYKLPDGELSLLTLASRGTTTTEQHSEQYPVANAPNYKDVIVFGISLETTDLDVISNILRYKQIFGSLKIEAKLSNAYSDNVSPYGWYMDFQQLGSGTHNIPTSLTPSAVALWGQNLIDTSQMKWIGDKAWSSFTKQDDQQISLDVENKFNFSDLVSLAVKVGGMYKYTIRYYNYDQAEGDLSISTGTPQIGARAYIVQQLPWLQYAPYNLDPSGNSKFNYSGFYDSGLNFGEFLNGEYSMHSAVKTNVIDNIMHILKDYRSGVTSSGDHAVLDPDYVQSMANDYSGHESRSAFYLMATLNVGQSLSIIPGVRYQELRTSYTATQFLGYNEANISVAYPHSTVTAENRYRYWLPDISIKFNPLEAIGIRASYTNTIAYPDFKSFIPILYINNSTHVITYNNTNLMPERAKNYDVQVSLHNNNIGLFAVGLFLKKIDDEIYNPGALFLDTLMVKAYGFPSSGTSVCTLYTYINNPFQVKVWGIETEWQTHFWYLPGPLGNLVMNVNYTHLFSQGTFSKRMLIPISKSKNRIVDTLYNDGLYQQPTDVANLSIGYDYKKFSILASMIYQSKVFNQPNFYWTLRSDKTKYLRWDIVVKQGLPWYNLEVYFDLNNLNKEADIYAIRKNGFPLSENSYGLTADLGVRWSL